MRKIINSILLSASILAISACHSTEKQLEVAEEVISTKEMANYIKVLASDKFQGRKPFSEGENKTINYIADLYREIGLEPVIGDSYFQEVPLVEITLKAPETMILQTPNKRNELSYGNDFVIFSHRLQKRH